MGAGGTNGPEITEVGIINIVLITFIANLWVMAVGFAILGGVLHFQGHPELTAPFASAAGFLLLLGAVLEFLRSSLVRLIEDWT